MAKTKFPSKSMASAKTFVDQKDMKKYLHEHFKKANATVIARVDKVKSGKRDKIGDEVPVFESVFFGVEDLKKMLKMDATGKAEATGAFFYLKSIQINSVDHITLMGVGAKEDGTLITDALTSDDFACPPDCMPWTPE